MHYYKEYINQKQKKLPTDNILNIQRIIIESSLDKESSTLKQKFEKEKEKVINNTEKEEYIPNGLSMKPNIINKKEKEIKKQDNLFVKPILETNEEKNLEDNNNDIEINNEQVIKNKKIGNNLINIKNNNNNKYLGTIVSVTSSEFRDGCKGLESFISTIKFDETKK